MGVYFTSDLHLGHERVAGIRGFDSTGAHDAAIAERWRATIANNDDVWILGDIAASSPFHSLAILKTLPGRKHLVYGNHDRGHPMNRDAHKWHAHYLGAFASVASAARRRIYGREVLLSHFPYERDRDEARYMQWRLRDEGLPLLHGHTHGEERLTHIPVLDRIGPYANGLRWRTEVHVGLDAWDLTPVSLDTVHGLLEEALA